MTTILVLLALAEPAGSSPTAWPEIRAALEDTVCVVRPEDAATRPYLSIGRRAACGLPKPSTAAQEVLQESLSRCGSLITSLRLDSVPLETNTPAEHLAKIKHDIVTNPDLLRSLLPRLSAVMRERSLSCPDLPVVGPIATREIGWAEFGPYLNAFVRVDAAEEVLDSEGLPTGKWRYGLHTCLEINGLDELRRRDPALERAGFVVAMDSAVILRRADWYLGQLMKAPEVKALKEAGRRTELLRGRMEEFVVTDREIRVDACRLLKEYRGDLGITVPECLRGFTEPPVEAAQ